MSYMYKQSFFLGSILTLQKHSSLNGTNILLTNQEFQIDGYFIITLVHIVPAAAAKQVVLTF